MHGFNAFPCDDPECLQCTRRLEGQPPVIHDESFEYYKVPKGRAPVPADQRVHGLSGYDAGHRCATCCEAAAARAKKYYDPVKRRSAYQAKKLRLA